MLAVRSGNGSPRQQQLLLQHHHCWRARAGLREGDVASPGHSPGRSCMNIVLKDSVRLAIERVFPRDPELRIKGLNDLKPKASVLETIRHAVGAVLWGYGEQ